MESMERLIKSAKDWEENRRVTKSSTNKEGELNVQDSGASTWTRDKDWKNSKLVVCLSTNGERALNYTIVKWLILTTNTQATKIKSSF